MKQERMLKVCYGGDGYPSNWVCTCGTCQAAACTFYYHSDSSYFCSDSVPAANPMALSRQGVWTCTACENAPAAVTCSTDEASFCINCDSQLRPVNPLALHSPPRSGLACSFSCTYRDDQLPGAMFDTENEIAAHTVLNEEIHEDETDSWLLLEPENSDNRAMSGFTYGEQLDEYMNIVDTCTEHQCQEQYSDQQQLLCVNYPEDSGSDSVVPVQTSEAKKQPQQEEKVQRQQQTHLQLQSVYFNTTEHKGSKAAFTSTPSTSLSDHMLLITAGILPNATSKIPNSSTRFLTGTADLFPDPLLLMPHKFTPMNREEKVLRYREKRKARKFEKKIRYASRKAYAETRPRVQGRFASKTYMG